MEAIILAGGLGTRLRQVLTEVPKPMAPIGDRPFLEVMLSLLVKEGFTKITLALGYKAEIISKYFGGQFAGIELAYVVEDVPLGTGGAARLAASTCEQDHFFLFNGDTFLDLEFDQVEQQWQRAKKSIIVSKMVSDTSRYGRLAVDRTRVLGIKEKGIAGPGLINAGCYVLSRDALDEWPFNKRISFENDYLEPQIARGLVETFVSDGMFIDIGIPEDYARAQLMLSDYL